MKNSFSFKKIMLSEWQNYLISYFDVLLNIIPYFRI